MSEPTIKIEFNNMAYLNSETLDEYFSDNFEYVELFHNPDENKLGFSEVEEPTDNSFLVYTHDEEGAVIDIDYMVGFMKIDIDSEVREYTPSREGDIVFVQL